MSTSTPRRERVAPNLYKRRDANGKLRWELGYRDGTKQRWEMLPPGTTKTAARARLAEVQFRKNRGEEVRPNPRLKLGAAADAWWKAEATRLRPATQNAYGASLTRLRARWGGARLAKIGTADIAEYIRHHESAPRTSPKGKPRPPLKGWTLRGDLTVLGRVFEHAAELGYSGQNPVVKLKAGQRPRSDEREKRILSAEELGRLIAAVDDRYRLLFEFTAATGCRLGEVLGVRWHALDFERGTVHISHQLDRQGSYVELKTKRSRRTLELPPSLVAKLREHKAASSHADDHDYAFCSRDGRGFDHRNIGGRVLKRAVKAAGLDALERDGEVLKAAPTFHSLRHSHGSALIASGWDIEEVSRRLGHGDTAITHRTYIHAYEASRRAADRSSRLEAIYGSVVEALNGSTGQETAAAVVDLRPFQARKVAAGSR